MRDSGEAVKSMRGANNPAWKGGIATHPLYYTHAGMKQRCFNPNSVRYSAWGGRGITICDRWLGPDGFWNFVEDMGPKPEGTSLDRFPDNDGNYEPGNCRWATIHEQSANKRPPLLPRGEDHHGTKLRELDVRYIFGLRELGHTQSAIANEFGITQAAVSSILSGKTWGHLGLAPKAAA